MQQKGSASAVHSDAPFRGLPRCSQSAHWKIRPPHPLAFNAQTFWRFLRFLKQLLRYRRGRRHMIERLDNARYYHTALLKPFLRRHAKHLRLLCLSPSSPQLASIERVWKRARRIATHNRYFPTLAEVKAVNGCFDRCRPPNRALRKPCCIV
jgi:hypothetical protein